MAHDIGAFAFLAAVHGQPCLQCGGCGIVGGLGFGVSVSTSAQIVTDGTELVIEIAECRPAILLALLFPCLFDCLPRGWWGCCKVWCLSCLVGVPFFALLVTTTGLVEGCIYRMNERERDEYMYIGNVKPVRGRVDEQCYASVQRTCNDMNVTSV